LIGYLTCAVILIPEIMTPLNYMSGGLESRRNYGLLIVPRNVAVHY